MTLGVRHVEGLGEGKIHRRITIATQDIAFTAFSHRREAEALSGLVRIGEDVWIGLVRALVEGVLRGVGSRARAVVQAKVEFRSGRSAGRVALQVPVGRPRAAIDRIGRQPGVEAYDAGDGPIANQLVDNTGRICAPMRP